jgi:hypothetical protein
MSINESETVGFIREVVRCFQWKGDMRETAERNPKKKSNGPPSGSARADGDLGRRAAEVGLEGELA